MTPALARARSRARRIYPRSTAFQGAYMKGVKAKLGDLSPESCPYPRDPRRSWRQNFRVAWFRGYGSV